MNIYLNKSTFMRCAIHFYAITRDTIILVPFLYTSERKFTRHNSFRSGLRRNLDKEIMMKERQKKLT